MKSRYVFISSVALGLFVLLSFPQTASSADTIKPGTGKFIFKDELGNVDQPITVWYHMPKRYKPASRIVFVMHGVGRTGENYRDKWIEYADQKNFLLITPEFSKKYYPSSLQYQQGNIVDRDGEPIEKSNWTFMAVEHLFDRVCEMTKSKRKTYSIYGHSAGGQFVHRMCLFLPEARFDLAIAANPGWYTMPDFNVTYPYGLGDSILDEDGIKKALNKRLLVLLGTKDTDPDDKNLRKTPEAMVQGKHRYARGMNFFKQGGIMARQYEIKPVWQMAKVPGAGHSNKQMAKGAARFIGR